MADAWIWDAVRGCYRQVADATLRLWRAWAVAHPGWHAAAAVGTVAGVACGAGVAAGTLAQRLATPPAASVERAKSDAPPFAPRLLPGPLPGPSPPVGMSSVPAGVALPTAGDASARSRREPLGSAVALGERLPPSSRPHESQDMPDRPRQAIPEPASLALLAALVAIVVLLRAVRR